jgi:predicted RNA methylase
LKRWMKLHVLKQILTADYFAGSGPHENMLMDKVRCEAYRAALAQMVRPGDIVVDLGAGTGLLSFLAVQAGARHVYAIEMSGIADLAAQLIEANNLRDCITLIRGNSRNIRLPERGDLLVTETLADCGFDNENIIGYTADARRRLLKPGARIIPESCDTFFMPIQSEEFGLGQFPARLYDLDYTPFRLEHYHKPLPVATNGKNLVELAEPVGCWHVDLLHATKAPGAGTIDFRIFRDGRLDGFLGWFETRLCPAVSLSNSPRLPATSWPQLYFPVVDQPRLCAGQNLRLEINPRVIAGEAQWEYRICFNK